MTQPFADRLLTGPELREALIATSHHLREVARAVDAINVYPVPDGDTGANMSGTFREAVDATLVLGEHPRVSEVLEALARGALYGARGNSGVILSQGLRGFAEGAGEVDRFDAAALARSLHEAATEAYAAVSKPQEGTMLTVLRAAAEGARTVCVELPGLGQGHPCASTLAAAIRSAEEAEAETINQLPELREARVPDAGGEGICVILRGLLAAISGGVAPQPALPSRPIAMQAGHAGEAFGFCTEFIVEAEANPIDTVRVKALAGGRGNRSVVVVGDERMVHVHVHTDQPQELLEAAEAFGRVLRAKVEDMTAQNARFSATGSGATAQVAILAMSRGEGFDAVFRGLGAHVSDLGEVEKPPARQIAAAADAIGARDVIVLPNHPNVILAAEQATKLTHCTLHVASSRTLPQGVGAAIAFRPDEAVARNLEAMTRAMQSVRTVEITIAAADRTADGVEVRRGEAIAMVDGRLVFTATSLVDALLGGLERASADQAGIITLYGGLEAGEAETQRAGSAVAARFPGTDVEAVYGGQPLYPFIASLED